MKGQEVEWYNTKDGERNDSRKQQNKQTMDIGINTAISEREKRKKTTEKTIGTKGGRVNAIVQ